MKRILLLAIVCSCAASLRAQSVAGSGVVSGWVLEREDEGMPDAEVILENPGMGVRRVIETSLDGVFEAVGLAPAPGYRLSIRHKNFEDWQSKEFEVLAGQRVTFRLIMQPASGGVAETPATGLPLVNQTPDSVGTVINAAQVNLLPVSKRRWEDLVPLAPAVTTSWPLGTAAVRADSFSNPYFTDGLLTSNTYSGKRAVPAGRIAEDAVQGFQVVTAAAPVEFGHGMGGVINTVTRSGGTGLHGSLYEYFSNDSMTAIDRYALGQSLFQKRNQMGFNLGGVVPKSKLFFFSNLEIQDSHGQGLNRITNPLLVNDGGTLPAVWNCHATSAQCAAASSFLQNQMNVLVPRSEHWITGLARLDYRRSDRHTLSLAVHGAHSRAPQGFDNEAVASDGGMLGNSLTRQDTHWARLEWTSAPSPNSSNELRFGLFHDRISNSASDSGLATGAASIVVAGVPLGESHPDPGILRERRTQLVDNLRMSKGAHTFLVGVDWTRTRDWLDSLANGSGTYYYSSLTAFAQDLVGGLGNNYTLYTQTMGNPIRNLPSSEIGFYAQDTWKATPRLQVTAGIRWSKPYLPQPTEYNETYYQTGTLSSPNINADPRIGLSYLLNDRTVVRASFGMFHASHPGALLDALFLGNGIYQSNLEITPAMSQAPRFPNAFTAAAYPAGSLDLMYADAKLRDPYTKQTTVAVERYLGGGATLSASYIGSRGVKLWTAEDVNLTATTDTATYLVADAAGQAVGSFTTPIWTARSTSDYAHIYHVTNGGSSWYRALVVQFRKQMGHGFSAQASYTWSHAIDDVGGPLLSGVIPLSTYGVDYRGDLGSSAADQRHRAVIDWTWQPRFLRSNSAAARYLVNGWEISSIATLASSQPATALVVVDGQQFSGVSTAFVGSLNGSGGWSRAALLPVNSLYSEPQYTVNARLARTIPLSERFTGRLVLEAFNVFNTQFNTSVNTTAYLAANGVLTPLFGAGAGNASQGYPNGTNARSLQVAFRIRF